MARHTTHGRHVGQGEENPEACGARRVTVTGTGHARYAQLRCCISLLYSRGLSAGRD